MRLTLRTLLAYLDDTLDPVQAKTIGQKVAESDTAQELIARIKQVTRRRRLTTPPETGPGGKIDANAIAGYLDNTLDADQFAEVEQTALASDVHLAEIAACHQILTLVLGEPALVPPTAKQRMYALVKGREAIPSRRPPTRRGREDELSESREIDETLRMGLPALRRQDSWSNRLVVLGGASALLVCLAIAIWLLLPSGRTGDGPRKASQQVAKVDDRKTDAGKKGATPEEKKGEKDSDKGTKTDEPKISEPKKEDEPKKAPVKPKTPTEVAHAPPSANVVELAKFDPGDRGSDLLLQAPPDGKGAWLRLERQLAKQPGIWSRQPLVSLPGFRSRVLTESGVRLTLCGSMPEYNPFIRLFESYVILHEPPEGLDVDLTLGRGQILLTNTRDGQPVRARVRFENPTDPSANEMWDITLEAKDSEVALQRGGGYPSDEPFFENPKDPQRKGPSAFVALIVMNGPVSARLNDVKYSPSEPGPVLFHWESRGGLKGPIQLKEVPPHIAQMPTLPKELEGLERERDDLRRAATQLNVNLVGERVDTGLLKTLNSGEKSQQKLAVRSFAALDQLPQLIDSLRDPNSAETRKAAIESLRYWTGLSRDNDYRVLQELQDRKFKDEARTIVELLHYLPQQAISKPETYDKLINHLVHKNLMVRELASWHLYQLVPDAQQKIPYDASAQPKLLEDYRAQWRKLVPPGTVPPKVGKAPGK